MKMQSFMTLGGIATICVVLTISGFACSSSPTAPPYDSVVVDRSNPQKTVVQFNGACAGGVASGRYDVPGKKDFAVTQDGKTYYFSSAEARDRFMEDFQTNAQKAENNWSMREKTPS